jgi:hypothetical protein
MPSDSAGGKYQSRFFIFRERRRLVPAFISQRSGGHLHSQPKTTRATFAQGGEQGKSTEFFKQAR